MSFDWNPYKHVELIVSDEDPNLWFWHCHSCGGDSERKGLVVPLSRAEELVLSFYEHIRKSHERRWQDFADWSKY